MTTAKILAVITLTAISVKADNCNRTAQPMSNAEWYKVQAKISLDMLIHNIKDTNNNQTLWTYQPSSQIPQ